MRLPIVVQLLHSVQALPDSSDIKIAGEKTQLKSVRVHFAYGSDGRSFFVEYS